MKNTKNIFSIVLVLCLALAAMMTLSSCDGILGTDPTPEHTHELTEVAAVKATCTEAGVEAYYTCSGCEKLFADAEGSVEIEAPKAIEAKGHEYKKTVYPANCTEAGYTKYACFNCDYSYSGDEVAANGHSFTSYVSDNNATCTADGTKTAKCDNCDATDTKADEGSKKGHSYGAASYSWSDDKSTCTATRVCANDANHVETETVNSTSETTPATCTAAGKTVYTASFTNSAFETQTTESVIEAKNHSYGAVSYSWSDDKSTCTATRVCANDANHIETETVNSTSATTPATCIAEGKIVYTADFTNDAFETQTEETILGMIEHTPGDAVKENIENATCAKDGSYDLVVYCSVENCKHEISRETITVKATGEHVYATEKEKLDATCTVDGYVIMACGCGETEKTTISATGHKYESKVTAPTCTEAGFTTYTCSVCGDNYTADEVDALGHKYESKVTAPTCTEEGFTTYTCSVCGDNYTADEVDALGHSWTGYELVTAPTYESTGLLGGTCANCDAPTYELPVVSAENGYTALITGVVTRWQYTYGDFSFTVDLENADATTTTYSYGVEAWYVGLDADGNPIMENGYKSTQAAWNTTYFGGRNYNYTTTIFVPNDTTVTLIFRVARNKTRPFFSDGVEWVLNDLFVNGSADGVIADTSSQVIGDGTSDAWEIFNDYQVATLFLKKGNNVITFITANSTNFAGIGFISTEELHMHTDVYTAPTASTCTSTGLTYGISCSVCEEILVAQTVVDTLEHGYAWAYSVTAEPTYTAEGAILAEYKCNNCNDVAESKSHTLPVISETDYVKKVTGVASLWEYTYEGQTFEFVTKETAETTTYEFLIAEGYDPFAQAIKGTSSKTFAINYAVDASGNRRDYYENTQKATFKASITVTEATSVSFIVTFVNGAKTYEIKDMISDITVESNGTEGRVERCDGTVTTTGWRAIHQSDGIIATVFLEAGENTITFTMGELNCSVRGFKVASTIPVALASEEN